ncbi:hydrolase 2, exosortase A system-associated [Massilia violaceinigra]|uniref:Hydrolase 2, exosortase A system-associated n=1 Tax=Massilia violaceinigra TaxID=2045208 RepID=A0A2D2DQ93_9BURK|nr:hydrolase 2, exosortase A system-associated [Massilia violaceinigra]ATQ77113.1 hydrolase 2, exosortase A system-associated [Massilia violaceinigra]
MNAPLLSLPRVLPFFFDAEPGTRFSLYHAPAPQVRTRGAILYVHPFADELNKSRRMATLQARRFAAAGYAVLQIDMFGCGDSCGDFSSARWELWKRDLEIARAWLAERAGGGPMHLWGIRLGGLLALDFACNAPVDGVILWQPFLNGRTCINQFLRQGLAARMRAGDPALFGTTSQLRADLLTRGMIEVGGYELAAPLIQAIDACDAAALPLPPCQVHWFASASPAPSRLAASAARIAHRWSARGATLHFHAVEGEPFWGANDIVECPALLAATSAVFAPEA